MTEPLDAVRDLSDAFAARDLGAALDCFVPGDDIGYAGSERDETATGRDALTALLGKVFLRDEAYSWTVTGATVHRFGAHAYVLAEAPNGTPDVILIGTGSEVQLAVSARETLAAEGINARVVSAPSLEWFAEQDEAYRESVLPASVTARVSVEAGLALTWRGIVGDKGRSVSIEHFGASADYKRLFQEFGITAEAVAAAAKESLAGLTN